MTTEATKEFLFQRWGRDYEIDGIVDVRGSSRTIRLSEFLDSEDFYKLIEKLKDLEKRASIKMLRKIRKSLLDVVDDTTKWIQKRLKEEMVKKAS